MLNNVMTLAEAAELWQLKQKSLMRRVIRNKDNLIGYASLSGNTWLITKEGMEKLFNKSDEQRKDELKQIMQEYLIKGDSIPRSIVNEYNRLNEKEND